MKPNPHIDAALDVTRRHMRPGDVITQADLAEICGCSRGFIFLIEQQALRKLREAVRKKLGLSYGQFSQTKVSDHL